MDSSSEIDMISHQKSVSYLSIQSIIQQQKIIKKNVLTSTKKKKRKHRQILLPESIEYYLLDVDPVIHYHSLLQLLTSPWNQESASLTETEVHHVLHYYDSQYLFWGIQAPCRCFLV